MRRTRAAGLAAIALAGTLLIPAAADARKATPAERTAIVAAWERELGIDESAACKRTWVIRVAQSKPRLASIWGSQLRVRHDCILGNGYGILRRPTPKSTRWRALMQRSDPPPCRLGSRRVLRQLGFTEGCVRW